MANVRMIAIIALCAARLAPAAAAAEPGAQDAEGVASAIEGGLRWLAAHQVKEGPDAGSWPAAQYPTAAAGFAGLAFLANGHVPGRGEYGEVVRRAMRYVQASQTPDGYAGARGDSMYIHAICSLFALSYLGMSENAEEERELAEWCRRSIDVILAAQKVRKRPWEQGGWRYSPYSDDSDTSVTSWQLLVLHAARQCGYEIDDGVFEDALKYVNSGFVETESGEAGFVYRPGISKDPEPGVTGASLFVKSIIEKEQDERAGKALALLRKHPPAWGGVHYKGYFFFGTFYMSQGLFQVSDPDWAAYRPAIQRVLLRNQEGDGHWPFPPDNKVQSRMAGEAYSTAMGVLILSLDKQYLPMYQKQKRLF
jgi:hypothetical protein